MTLHRKLYAACASLIPIGVVVIWLMPSEVYVSADGEVTMGEMEPPDSVACYTFRIDGKLEYECTDLGLAEDFAQEE